MKKKLPLLLSAGLLAASLNAQAGLELDPIASGFVSPMALEEVDDGSGRKLIVDQSGTISVLAKKGLRDSLFMDVRPKLAKLNQGKFDERGLLGLALHPKFAKNGKFYVYYSAPLREGGPEGWNHTSHVSEFKADVKGLKADLGSERVLLRIDQPQFNHDGGRIAFGPDGHLYISSGDGGNKNDVGKGHVEGGNGQSIKTLLGKILRIDVNKKSGDRQYGIPSDNPYVGKAGLDEIYAIGMRNPWAISFDKGGKNQLFCADVGQNMFEEVDIIEKGGNYGWPVREGFHGFNLENPIAIAEGAPKKDAWGNKFKDPILVYKNIKGHQSNRYAKEIRGTSITGGYVYRGKAIPELKGQYIFGDWSQIGGVPLGQIFAANKAKGNGKWKLRKLALENLPKGKRLGAYVIAFGQDLDGEIYVMTNDSNSLKGKSGKVWKLVKK